MTSFLDYYKRKTTIKEIEEKAKTYNMEETLLVITDMMKFEDDFFHTSKKKTIVTILIK